MTSVKKLAKRKLKEFPRWCRVAVLHHDKIQISEDWTVKLFEFDPEDYKGRVHGWQREAPEEVNEILKAINAIAKPRQRAILIMCYIGREATRLPDQERQLGIKPSTYYADKSKAFQAFAELYRGGALLEYLKAETVKP
ncbi:TPA: ArpU family transcriptional regulator [Streptococcus suis]|nr:ArpU family transcriptional regulator [Streptococcus suis]HEM3703835.1 ArpU family transcriptional regulator [Streptococcus suis]